MIIFAPLNRIHVINSKSTDKGLGVVVTFFVTSYTLNTNFFSCYFSTFTIHLLTSFNKTILTTAISIHYFTGLVNTICYLVLTKHPPHDRINKKSGGINAMGRPSKDWRIHQIKMDIKLSNLVIEEANARGVSRTAVVEAALTKHFEDQKLALLLDSK